MWLLRAFWFKTSELFREMLVASFQATSYIAALVTYHPVNKKNGAELDLAMFFCCKLCDMSDRTVTTETEKVIW